MDKYGFKGTFFCKGSCAEKNPHLVKEIIRRGHSIGNHTYEHILAYDRNGRSYVKDVYRADNILHTLLFRPPNGCLTLYTWWKLRKKFRIIYWSIGSYDWCKDETGQMCGINSLGHINRGNIILFHFSKELQEGTQRILPLYLQWLADNKYTSKAITNTILS